MLKAYLHIATKIIQIFKPKYCFITLLKEKVYQSEILYELEFSLTIG